MKKINKKYFLAILTLVFSYSFGQNANASQISFTVENIKRKMQIGKYILAFERKCNLNKDGILDEILLFNGKTNEENDIETLDSPIFIVLSKSDKTLKNINVIYTSIPNNSNLDNNLVVKKNYFTIEQTTGNGNSKETKYITFKFLNKKIFLYKYGITTSSPKSDKIIKSTKIYTITDFGNIPFENFNIETINSKKEIRKLYQITKRLKVNTIQASRLQK